MNNTQHPLQNSLDNIKNLIQRLERISEESSKINPTLAANSLYNAITLKYLKYLYEYVINQESKGIL